LLADAAIDGYRKGVCRKTAAISPAGAGRRLHPLKLRFVWHHGWYHVFVRIVLDTASFVTAVRSSDGAAGEVVRMIFREEIVPLMDFKLGLEYRDVALRSEHVKASALSKREILELIEAMEGFAEPVEVVMKTRPLSPDPSDDMVLDVAINGRAEALVTSNKKHFAAAGNTHGKDSCKTVTLRPGQCQ
jgi:putative PIN family toxin of toxin-antitoxin system